MANRAKLRYSFLLFSLIVVCSVTVVLNCIELSDDVRYFLGWSHHKSEVGRRLGGFFRPILFWHNGTTYKRAYMCVCVCLSCMYSVDHAHLWMCAFERAESVLFVVIITFDILRRTTILYFVIFYLCGKLVLYGVRCTLTPFRFSALETNVDR